MGNGASYRIECHDGDVGQGKTGTLFGTVMARSASDAEERVLGIFKDHEEVCRCYVVRFGLVRAIFARDDTGKMYNVARHMSFNGSWRLEPLYGQYVGVWTLTLGVEVEDLLQAERRIKMWLNDHVVSVVVLHPDGIVAAAWEPGPKLVARGHVENTTTNSAV